MCRLSPRQRGREREKWREEGPPLSVGESGQPIPLHKRACGEASLISAPWQEASGQDRHTFQAENQEQCQRAEGEGQQVGSLEGAGAPPAFQVNLLN